MVKKIEKIVTPERVVLEDGRHGYFISAPVTTDAVVIIKYPASKPARKKSASKSAPQKKVRSSSGISKSIIKALREVKARKKSGNYPSKDFDTLMDEL